LIPGFERRSCLERTINKENYTEIKEEEEEEKNYNKNKRVKENV
jgi:hypothetical protein